MVLSNYQLDKEKSRVSNAFFNENGFFFRNKTSEDFYLYVESYPQQVIPARKRTTITVPGRSGDLHIEENAFENVVLPFACYFHAPVPMPTALSGIANWLNVPGYWPLTSAYDPEHIRMASFLGPVDVENHLNRYGRCILRFDCKPQRYHKSGLQSIMFEETGFLRHMGYGAEPVITVRGTGPGAVTIGDCTVEIRTLEDVITLDCVNQNAYRQIGNAPAENKNKDIYAPRYPTLGLENNIVTWNGGISSVEIEPRWWNL